MSAILYLIPISLVLGVIGLLAFLWTLKHGQYEDLEGAAARILEDEDKPLPRAATTEAEKPNPPQSSLDRSHTSR